MKNRFLAACFFRTAVNFTLLLASTVLLISDPTQASPLSFKPPISRGRPKVTIGGASRSDCIQVKDPKGLKELSTLTALLPNTGLGLTTSNRATIMLYVPQNKGKQFRVSFKQVGQNSGVEPKSFSVPASAGLVRLSLEDAGFPELQLGKQYLWKVELMCESQISIGSETFTELTAKAMVEGVVERIVPDKVLQEKLKKADPKQLPRLYAEAGIWQDALMTLQDQRREKPHSADLNGDWESLLKSAGLTNLAQVPMADCCKLEMPTPSQSSSQP